MGSRTQPNLILAASDDEAAARGLGTNPRHGIPRPCLFLHVVLVAVEPDAQLAHLVAEELQRNRVPDRGHRRLVVVQQRRWFRWGFKKNLILVLQF